MSANKTEIDRWWETSRDSSAIVGGLVPEDLSTKLSAVVEGTPELRENLSSSCHLRAF